MKRTRVYAPWLLSLGAFLLTANAVFAGTVGPYTITGSTVGWDWAQWRNTAASTKATVKLKACKDHSSGAGVWVDVKVWRNAGLFPPENQGQKRFYCSSTSTWTAKTWGSGAPNMTGPENFWWENRGFQSGSSVDFKYKVSWDG